jgi:hypothetical protein
MKKRTMGAWVAMGLMCQGIWAAEPVLTLRSAAQKPGTKMLVVTYDVTGAEDDHVDVSARILVDGQPIPATSFTGDYGPRVRCGTGKQFAWDAGADWDGNKSAGVVLELTAVEGDVICPPGADPNAVAWRILDERFVRGIYANGDEILADTAQGKLWVDLGRNNYEHAKLAVSGYTRGGYSNWRLPSRSDYMAAVSRLWADKFSFDKYDVYNERRRCWTGEQDGAASAVYCSWQVGAVPYVFGSMGWYSQYGTASGSGTWYHPVILAVHDYVAND